MGLETEKLKIVLPGDKTGFAPRETIQGAVEWNLDTSPRRLDLSLFWYTSGKGTRDVGMVHNVWFDDPGAHGSKEFSFTLPEGPFSFSGKLISVIWAIELTCSPGSETTRREITVSPTGKEILLGSVAAQARPLWGRKDNGPDQIESILRAGG